MSPWILLGFQKISLYASFSSSYKLSKNARGGLNAEGRAMLTTFLLVVFICCFFLGIVEVLPFLVPLLNGAQTVGILGGARRGDYRKGILLFVTVMIITHMVLAIAVAIPTLGTTGQDLFSALFP